MAFRTSALELLFKRLHYDRYDNIHGILQDAKTEYRVLVEELDRDERKKVNYIKSIIDYCDTERWGLAKNQLNPAEEEFYRYFFRKLTPGQLADQRTGSNTLDSRISNVRPGSETQAPRRDAAARPYSENIQKATKTPTDLSDLSTRQKIAEKFEDIFKNEWTDALAELENYRVHERNAITCLLKIVLDAYRVCSVEADAQIVKLEDAASSILLEGIFSHVQRLEGHRSYLMEYRRRGIADICIERLQEDFRRRYLPEIIRSIGVYQNIRNHGPVQKYANQCVTICWAMAILDPQVHVVDDRDRPGVFKKELYKRYSKSGLSVDFYVWPPLFTDKHGKLLSKGIAEGR